MSDHLVDTVNAKDEVIGAELKSQKAELDYTSRVSAVFISDFENNLFICKRASHKKYSPNLYDLAAVGAVLQGETYQESAQRELLEELGVTCKLTLLDKFYMEAESINNQNKLKYFCGVFFGKTAEKPILNEELSEIRKISFDNLKKEIKTQRANFCPGFLADYYQVEEKLGQILENN